MRVTFVDGLATALPGTDLPPGEATIDDCIHIAHATGAGAINVVHMTGRPTPLPEMADAFGRACERAEREDLRLAIEFIPETGIPDFATAAAIVREAGHPRGFGAPRHLAPRSRRRSARGPHRRRPRARRRASSSATARPNRDSEPYVARKGRKIPGDGALPLAELTADLRRLHPDLPIGIEVLSDEIDDSGSTRARAGWRRRSTTLTAATDRQAATGAVLPAVTRTRRGGAARSRTDPCAR